MSSWICGCDPEAERHCDFFPHCSYGRTQITQRPQAKTLPVDPKTRKTFPVYSGVLAYFPDALVEIAHVSWVGNEQHNPGTPLHWDRAKSQDEKDAEVRHLIEPLTIGGSKFDSDGVRHSAKKAWRALADLQKEIEEERR